MFWQLPGTAGANAYGPAYQATGGYVWTLYGASATNTLRATIRDAAAANYTSGSLGTIVVARWFDVALVFDGTGLRCYVDGRLITRVASGSVLGGTGLMLRWGLGSTQSPEAVAEHCMFWNRTLGDAEACLVTSDPYCMFARRVARQAMLRAVGASGVIGGDGAVEATAFMRPRAAWSGGSLTGQGRWLRGMLWNGADATAVRLGTYLTRGRFWTRTAGCRAVYRGLDGVMDYESVEAVGAAGEQVVIPAQSLPPNTRWRYAARDMSDCGRESGDGPACEVRIGADGQMRPLCANVPQQVTAEPLAGGQVRVRWVYATEDQEAAPAQFRVYIDGGDGFDFEAPAGEVEAVGLGGGVYEWTSGELADGLRHRFCVRGVSAAGAETAHAGFAAAVVDSSGPSAVGAAVAVWEEDA